MKIGQFVYRILINICFTRQSARHQRRPRLSPANSQEQIVLFLLAVLAQRGHPAAEAPRLHTQRAQGRVLLGAAPQEQPGRQALPRETSPQRHRPRDQGPRAHQPQQRHAPQVRPVHEEIRHRRGRGRAHVRGEQAPARRARDAGHERALNQRGLAQQRRALCHPFLFLQFGKHLRKASQVTGPPSPPGPAPHSRRRLQSPQHHAQLATQPPQQLLDQHEQQPAHGQQRAE